MKNSRSSDIFAIWMSSKVSRKRSFYVPIFKVAVTPNKFQSWNLFFNLQQTFLQHCTFVSFQFLFVSRFCHWKKIRVAELILFSRHCRSITKRFHCCLYSPCLLIVAPRIECLAFQRNSPSRWEREREKERQVRFSPNSLNPKPIGFSHDSYSLIHCKVLFLDVFQAISSTFSGIQSPRKSLSPTSDSSVRSSRNRAPNAHWRWRSSIKESEGRKSWLAHKTSTRPTVSAQDTCSKTITPPRMDGKKRLAWIGSRTIEVLWIGNEFQ